MAITVFSYADENEETKDRPERFLPCRLLDSIAEFLGGMDGNVWYLDPSGLVTIDQMRALSIQEYISDRAFVVDSILKFSHSQHLHRRDKISDYALECHHALRVCSGAFLEREIRARAKTIAGFYQSLCEYDSELYPPYGRCYRRGKPVVITAYGPCSRKMAEQREYLIYGEGDVKKEEIKSEFCAEHVEIHTTE